jgi:hypothetical protein
MFPAVTRVDPWGKTLPRVSPRSPKRVPRHRGKPEESLLPFFERWLKSISSVRKKYLISEAMPFALVLSHGEYGLEKSAATFRQEFSCHCLPFRFLARADKSEAEAREKRLPSFISIRVWRTVSRKAGDSSRCRTGGSDCEIAERPGRKIPFGLEKGEPSRTNVPSLHLHSLPIGSCSHRL